MFSIPKRFAGIKRFEQILKVMTKYEMGYYLERIGVKKKSLFSRKRTTRPVELRMMLEELGGTFVKLGQLLSLRPDLIPREYCDELSKLQDDCEPVPYNEIEHVIKAELKQPVKKLFKSFEKQPLASASIGQVHVAKLKNGKKVAVKVMRPGIKALIESDLEILDYLSRLLKHHLKSNIIDPEEIFDEFKHYSENELDYLKEAHTIKLFYNNFRKERKVRIPQVYEKLTTKKVLTMEFIEGAELKKVIVNPKKYKGINKKRVSELIVASVMKQIFVDGLFHADPHPGNIIVKNDSIGFIDFGITCRMDNEMREKLELFFSNLLSRNTNGLVKSFISLNIVDADVDVNALKRDLAETLGEYYDTAMDRIDMADLFIKSLSVARKHSIRFPRDLVLLGKALITLQGVNIELNPEFNLVQATRPFITHLEKQKTKSSYLLRRLAMETQRFAEFVHDLPDESRKVYNTVQKADVALDSINNDLRSLTTEIRLESWRIIMGIIVAALIIGASLAYNIEPFLSKTFILLAGIIVLYLLYSIVRDSFRRRRV